jgi:Fur family ferric uptake transcriptional regulator
VASPAVSADDRVRALLEAAGVQYSGARRKVTARLAAARHPMSAEDVHLAEPSVPSSSVYRALAVLAHAGAARRLIGADGIARFELAEAVSGDHHHYLLCSRCGTMDIVVLPAAVEDGLAGAARAVQQAGRFSVESWRVELTGQCEACAARDPSAARPGPG